MARKFMNTSKNLSRLSFEITDDKKNLLKSMAALSGKSIREIMEEVIDALLLKYDEDSSKKE